MAGFPIDRCYPGKTATRASEGIIGSEARTDFTVLVFVEDSADVTGIVVAYVGVLPVYVRIAEAGEIPGKVASLPRRGQPISLLTDS